MCLMHSKPIRILELLIRPIAISNVLRIPRRWSLTICPPSIFTKVSLITALGPYEVGEDESQTATVRLLTLLLVRLTLR